MKALELNILNRLAPYEVELRDGEYYFHTDFDIVYSAEFKYEPAFGGTPAYWFDLTNRSCKASPSDPKVRETVIRIIIEFSSQPRHHALYVRQRQRPAGAAQPSVPALVYGSRAEQTILHQDRNGDRRRYGELHSHHRAAQPSLSGGHHRAFRC